MAWTFNDKRPTAQQEVYDPVKVTALQIGNNVIRVLDGTYEEDIFPDAAGRAVEIFRFLDKDSPTTSPEWVIGKTESIQAMWCRQ